MVSVCALLLHAPYLYPHTRLPTGIIACTHGSPLPVLAVTRPLFLQLAQRDSNSVATGIQS
jgi:hypothetical protein